MITTPSLLILHSICTCVFCGVPHMLFHRHFCFCTPSSTSRSPSQLLMLFFFHVFASLLAFPVLHFDPPSARLVSLCKNADINLFVNSLEASLSLVHGFPSSLAWFHSPYSQLPISIACSCVAAPLFALEISSTLTCFLSSFRQSDGWLLRCFGS